MIHLLLKTKNFIPNEYHNSFFDIDFEKLYKIGYRLILCDVDNTLISYEEKNATTEVKQKIAEINSLGFELIFISNNVPDRIKVFTEDLDNKGFGNARKPLKIGFNKALKASTITAVDETIIIGDQLMTDIWGANRFDAYSILVNPIKKKTEKWYTKMNRKIELKMLQKIKKHYPQKWVKLELDKRL